MIEGWHGKDYLILFDEAEAADYSEKYELNRYLPNYRIVGLKGWDDFIVNSLDSGLATVPTVPLAPDHLAPLGLVIDKRQMKPDNRFAGKVKWCIKPIVFGGDPGTGDNLTWVTFEQHIQLVKWWNDLYRKLKSH